MTYHSTSLVGVSVGVVRHRKAGKLHGILTAYRRYLPTLPT